VTVTLRYAYGASRWTPVQLQKMQYLNHDCIFKIYLRLSFTQIICIILNTFLRLRRDREVKFRCLRHYLSPTLIEVGFFAFVCYFSSVFCKWQLCYRFHGHFVFNMLPCNTGALPSYFRDWP